jgi:hypothetical protein
VFDDVGAQPIACFRDGLVVNVIHATPEVAQDLVARGRYDTVTPLDYSSNDSVEIGEAAVRRGRRAPVTAERERGMAE